MHYAAQGDTIDRVFVFCVYSQTFDLGWVRWILQGDKNNPQMYCFIVWELTSWARGAYDVACKYVDPQNSQLIRHMCGRIYDLSHEYLLLPVRFDVTLY